MVLFFFSSGLNLFLLLSTSDSESSDSDSSTIYLNFRGLLLVIAEYGVFLSFISSSDDDISPVLDVLFIIPKLNIGSY